MHSWRCTHFAHRGCERTHVEHSSARPGEPHAAWAKAVRPPHTRAMPKTYAELLAEVRGQIRIISLEDLKARLESPNKPILVDVREKDEWRQGYVAGAVHIPRGFLEMQAETKLPDKNAPIVTMCAGGGMAPAIIIERV